MTRSEALRRSVAGYCIRRGMLPPGGLALCAVSGGRDSMALLHILSALAEEGDFRVAAAHFNHRLRPTADRDEALVRSWCGEREIPLAVGSGDVGAFARSAGTSLEDAARTLRYRFLEETAASMGADRIATAHHREDNAETVLLHLLRGSGLHGLGGIPPVRGNIVRPLLETSRADIDAYIAANRIPFAEDETNADPRYTRNRIRLEVLPLLEEIAPGAAGRIAAAAALLREDDEHMRREAERVLLPPPEAGRAVQPLPLLLRQDTAIRRRMVRGMAARLGVELTGAQTDGVLGLRTGGVLDLPGGLRAVRRAHQLILERAPEPPAPLELREGEQTWGPWRVRLTRGGPPPAAGADTVSLRDTGGALVMAAWDGGGRLRVENGSRTVKRLFADAGIPVEKRGEYPALYREGVCVAVVGVAVDRDQRPEPGEDALTVSIEFPKN